MMKRVKRRTFAGAICIQEVYNVADGTDVKQARPPRPRFNSEEERARHRDEISRRRVILLVNENFTTASWYVTLTFNEANECHSPKECRALMTRYIRRLKYRYPDAVIMGFYGQGETTSRFHVHLLIDGVPEEYINSQWYYGSVRDCRHLRAHNKYNGVDHGQDYTALANYLFNHWRPEFGGHRYFITRNARKPEQETPREAKREYNLQKPPRAPRGYLLVEAESTNYGYHYFKYIKIPDPIRKDP